MTRRGDLPTRFLVAASLATSVVGIALVLWAPAASAQDRGSDPSGSVDDKETVTPTPNSSPVAPAQAAVSPDRPAENLGDAVQQDARHFGWPLVIAVLVWLFLFFQGQVDRQEPKMADAPLDQGERLRFRS